MCHGWWECLHSRLPTLCRLLYPLPPPLPFLNQPKARVASERNRVVIPTKYIVKEWLVDWRRIQRIKMKGVSFCVASLRGFSTAACQIERLYELEVHK